MSPPGEKQQEAQRDAQSIFVRTASRTSNQATASSCPAQDSSASACPVAGSSNTPADPAGTAGDASACPVVGGSAGSSSGMLNAMNLMPNDRNTAGPEQTGTLGTGRVVSTIPVADPKALPGHQQAEAADGTPTWSYPSEQMFYNAMKRKGWNPSERDMSVVVQIHNAVNERAWAHVLHWEQLHARSCNCPKLLKFRGRPNDYSPRAMLLNTLGYKLPFDRHDWVVDRCGTEVRYIIDFYNADTRKAGTPAAMHLDVRPALDSFGAVVDRVRMAIVHMLA